ncbi:hypothetical protein Spla01_01716 [Streptomyces platensis]|uniref:Uncharacterized protein n=1 Tax=Streptomyces platensis TaxID=58346 RepID=A0ABX3Y635_STRPT|nr:hypothetical protein BG653_00411 [Streptomyces platensis]
MEWINPEYADLVRSMRIAEAAIGSDDRPPLRGFLIPGSAGDGDQQGPSFHHPSE